MHTIIARNVNDALVKGSALLRGSHITVNTRNGPAMVYPMPVTTWYTKPRERVLWDLTRDANPFFHLIESLWMLDGRNDTTLMTYLVPHMATFAEEEPNVVPYFHGAYGYRWRYQFGMDQLREVINLLKQNPRDRRIVLQMWDCDTDLAADKRDVPCNVTIKFMADHAAPSKLNMIVFCRSNDIIWGAYGANAVHMSVLQECVAAHAGMEVGWYQQISADYHAYVDVFKRQAPPSDEPALTPYNTMERVRLTPIVTDASTFFDELAYVMGRLEEAPHILYAHECQNFKNRIFFEVVYPMMLAYRDYRNGDANKAVDTLSGALTAHGYYDWLWSAQLWMSKRALKFSSLGNPEE